MYIKHYTLILTTSFGPLSSLDTSIFFSLELLEFLYHRAVASHLGYLFLRACLHLGLVQEQPLIEVLTQPM